MALNFSAERRTTAIFERMQAHNIGTAAWQMWACGTAMFGLTSHGISSNSEMLCCEFASSDHRIKICGPIITLAVKGHALPEHSSGIDWRMQYWQVYVAALETQYIQ